ncbi:MAG: polyamine aminopropyltransferase [Syntrophomonadaceae bacterium]|nr:polyamine aminopropyltransferase [Syntrophomonadaceae bacterium]MDD3888436.1 polyamine aminopropyltransferase [Syntrophomonadaceae bacterium]MDD4549188.1 polyamine aminopropyltransferase [Syntrophomonadaceae bacterium]
MELWVTEYQTPALGFACKARETLRTEQTDYQHLSVVVTEQFGKMLLLDGMVMTTEKDEYVYHEMITMVALNSHPHPKNVLIIGGGDGGALREVVRHPGVEKATLVEIDERVVKASRDFFPELSCSFDETKAQLIIADGVKYVSEHKNSFDIIIVDSTEPVGPAVELFSKSFYQNVYECLNDEGMLVVQSESPFFNQDVIKMAYNGINDIFLLTRLYLANIPTYPSGLWSFTIGSKVHNPEEIKHECNLPCKYYTPEIHQAAFKLPAFVQTIIAAGE